MQDVKNSDPYYHSLIKKNLHPVFWNSDQEFIESVAEQLVLIATKFFESLDLNTEIKDIVLVGSLANYNWHSLSDLDAHIILDYDTISSDNELVDSYLELERKQWNNEHDIAILGFPIELSFNDIEDEINSAGIYSLMNNEWIKKPSREILTTSTIDESEEIFKIITNAIDEIIQKYNNATITPLKAYRRSKQIWKIIKKLRSDFLEEEGEFGPKNITFKRLRNEDYLEKITSFKTKTHDDIFSINSLEEL